MGRRTVHDDPNERYFRTHFARLVKEHGGKWIVLANGELVGIGREKDVDRLMAEARDRHPETIPFAAPIPVERDLQCLL
jgi:hypothetical protein